MQKRILGRTGLEVGAVSMGGAFVTTSEGESLERSYEAIHRAFELGMNYIDTAPTYGNSEEVLGEVLQDVKTPYVLSTKLGGRPEPFEPKNKDHLRRSLDESLRLLKRDHIDILMIHEPDRPRQYDWWTDYDNFHGPVADFLVELKDEGVITFTGLGGTTAYDMARIIRTGAYDVVLTAFNYSILWREAAIAVLPAAKEMNVGVIAGSPLQQGALSQRYDEQVQSGARWLSPPRREQYKKLYAYLDEVNMPITEMAMRFVLSNPDIDTILTGARSIEEVEANVAAVEKGPLPHEMLDRLQKIADMVPFRPFDEPFGLPFRWDYPGPGRASH